MTMKTFLSAAVAVASITPFTATPAFAQVASDVQSAAQAKCETFPLGNNANARFYWLAVVDPTPVSSTPGTYGFTNITGPSGASDTYHADRTEMGGSTTYSVLCKAMNSQGNNAADKNVSTTVTIYTTGSGTTEKVAICNRGQGPNGLNGWTGSCPPY